jgi:hypothetical protein
MKRASMAASMKTLTETCGLIQVSTTQNGIKGGGLNDRPVITKVLRERTLGAGT